VRLSHNEGVDIRRPLLRVLTDLYVQEKSHTREEEQQYAELALRLLPAVDVATRAAIARKLAGYPLTPPAVIAALQGDAPEVAAIIAAAPAFAAAKLADKVPTRAEAPMEAIAAPPHDPARFAAPFAAETIRQYANIGEAFLKAERAERVAFLDPPEGEPIAPFGGTVELPARPGASRRLERAAMQGNTQEFMRELQLSLGISGRIATRIVHDDSGEPLLVAAKALGVESNVLVRILLFLNPKIGESVERVFALTYVYDGLMLETVLPVVASWRDEAAGRPTARFQPLHAPDAGEREQARPSREVAEPAERRHITADPRQRDRA
jgi:hypothetical protein